MKKLILRWLFGIDDVKRYIELLRENMNLLGRDIDHCNECIGLIKDHKKTLEREKRELDMIRKLLRICENHGIDVDDEIKHIDLIDEDLDDYEDFI